MTEGNCSTAPRLCHLIEGIEAECLLADKAYDTNEIIALFRELGMDPVITAQKQPEAKSGTMTGQLRTSCVHLVERLQESQALVARSGDPLSKTERSSATWPHSLLRAVMVWSKLF